MQHPHLPLAVTLRRVPLTSRWVSEKWEVDGVAPDEPSADITCQSQGVDSWLWRGFTLDLHPSEAEGYFLNISAPDPRVFVMWRLEEWDGNPTARPWVTTLSYHEAARMMDAGETVDSVPMPQPVRDWLLPWLEVNYKPEPRRKQRRNQTFWREEGAPEAGTTPADKP
jgi:hypothetical protein